MLDFIVFFMFDKQDNYVGVGGTLGQRRRGQKGLSAGRLEIFDTSRYRGVAG